MTRIRFIAIVLLALVLPARLFALDVRAPELVREPLSQILSRASEELKTEIDLHCYHSPDQAITSALREKRADVFIAADADVLSRAEKAGLAGRSHRPLIYRRLSIVIRRFNPKLILALDDLLRPDVKVALMKPESTIVGRLTDESLKRAGLREPIRENTVLIADSDAQIIDALTANRVDAAIAFDTIELGRRDSITILRLPWKFCPSQPMPAAVTSFTTNPDLARRLIDLLSSKESRHIFVEHGYWPESGESGGQGMDKVARTRFAPMYPLLAKQIISDYRITTGVCVDIGCGPGQLPIEIAKITRLKIYGTDIEPQALEIARQHRKEAGLDESRLNLVATDAHSLPFPDNFADLVISRGCWPFLRDKILALKEAYRILKPGGVGFIGGGFSRYQTKEEVERMQPKRRCAKLDFAAMCRAAEIPKFRVIRDNGTWAEIRK